MRTRIEEEDDTGIDMAPLIDIVFLLLIFFLVATTLKKIDRELQVELPDAVTAVKTKLAPDTVVVGLDAQGKLYLKAELVSIDQFHAELKRTATENQGARVRINADRNTKYSDIIHVIDQIQFWGFTDVGFHLRDQNRGK